MTGRAEESDDCDANMADHHTLENSLQLSDERSDMKFRQIYFHFLEQNDFRNEELQVFNYRRDGNFKKYQVLIKFKLTLCQWVMQNQRMF